MLKLAGAQVALAASKCGGHDGARDVQTSDDCLRRHEARGRWILLVGRTIALLHCAPYSNLWEQTIAVARVEGVYRTARGDRLKALVDEADGSSTQTRVEHANHERRVAAVYRIANAGVRHAYRDRNRAAQPITAIACASTSPARAVRTPAT